MGLLDAYLNPSFVNDPAASNMPNPALWGALNQPSPVQGETEQERRAREAAAIGALGIDPASLPQRSPFDVPQQALPAAAPAAPTANGFGAGATPFGFAGPGSMTNVNPSQFAAA